MRRARRSSVVALAALVVAQLASVEAQAAPARFVVGAATRSVQPLDDTMATHVGGYGTCRGCPTTDVRQGDDFVVRAMYVSNGTSSVVMVAAPFEGWFAGYQQEFDATGAQVDRLGITSLRQDAAAALTTASGFAVGQEDIIVSTIHCHACPTLIGVWAPTNVTYLRYVYQQTLAAIAAAQQAAEPATLRWATADIGYANDVTVGQANANEGWPIDGVPVHGVRDTQRQFVVVTVPCPGSYVIDASLPGTSATWRSVMHVYSADRVTNTAFYPEGTGKHPLAMQNLNDGPTGC